MKLSKDPVRQKIKKLEVAMMKQKEVLAKLRRKTKPQLVADYIFQTPEGKRVLLSSLFGKQNELIWVHNMGTSCPYCTLWADGFQGIRKHLENRAAFVVETPDAPKTIASFRKSRGWEFAMVSSRGTTFRQDMGYANQGDPWPGVSTFVKKGKKIFRLADTGFGPGDNFCAAWDFFDLLPKKEWGPKFRY